MDTRPVRLTHMKKKQTNKTKAITTAEACTTVWLYKTYGKFNGVFFFSLALKEHGSCLSFTLWLESQKRERGFDPGLLLGLQIGAQTILKMCHSYWADSRKGGKWILPSIQLDSFKHIIVHRVRHEVSSSMFLSVDILAKLVVLLLRSASLRILWKVNYVLKKKKKNQFFFFKLSSLVQNAKPLSPLRRG